MEQAKYTPDYIWVDSRIKGEGKIGMANYTGQSCTMTLDELQECLDKYNACAYYKNAFYGNVNEIPFRESYESINTYGMPTRRYTKNNPKVIVVPKGTTIDSWGKVFIFPKN